MDRRRITFEDTHAATADALVGALDERIDRNLRRFSAAIERIEESGDACECGDDDCTRAAYLSEEDENDAVGYAMDSFRLARVIVALHESGWV